MATGEAMYLSVVILCFLTFAAVLATTVWFDRRV
jgi:hypothetical protein